MKCPQCPNYDQRTSYGTEIIKCNNGDCPNWKKTEDPCEEHIRRAIRGALRRMENEEL